MRLTDHLLHTAHATDRLLAPHRDVEAAALHSLGSIAHHTEHLTQARITFGRPCPCAGTSATPPVKLDRAEALDWLDAERAHLVAAVIAAA